MATPEAEFEREYKEEQEQKQRAETLKLFEDSLQGPLGIKEDDTHTIADLKKDLAQLEQILKPQGLSEEVKEQQWLARRKLQNYCSVFYASTVRLAAAQLLLANSVDAKIDEMSLKIILRLDKTQALNSIVERYCYNNSLWLSDADQQTTASVHARIGSPIHTQGVPVIIALPPSSQSRPRDSSRRLRCMWAVNYLFSGPAIDNFGVASLTTNNKIAIAKALSQVKCADDPYLRTDYLLELYAYCLSQRFAFNTIVDEESPEYFLVKTLKELNQQIPNYGAAYKSYMQGLQFQYGFNQEGINIEVNVVQMFLNFKEACLHPNATANMHFALARCYASGIGVARDPKQEKAHLFQAQQKLKKIPGLSVDNAIEIFTSHLRNFVEAYQSSAALELLTEHYLSLPHCMPIEEIAGLFNEFSDTVGARIDSANEGLCNSFNVAKQTLATKQTEFQQHSHNHFTEHMINRYRGMLNDKGNQYSAAEVADALLKLKRLSENDYNLATKALITHYVAIPMATGIERAVFYRSRLGRNPKYFYTDWVMGKSDTVRWFHNLEQLAAWTEGRVELPSWQGWILGVIQQLIDIAKKTNSEIIKWDLQCRLYSFYQMIEWRISEKSVKSQNEIEIHMEMQGPMNDCWFVVRDFNDDFILAESHLIRGDVEKAITALERAANRSVGVVPYIDILLARFYSDPTLVPNETAEAQAKRINPEKEKACFERLQKFNDELLGRVELSPQSFVVSLRHAARYYQSTTAITLLAQHYLSILQELDLEPLTAVSEKIKRAEECSAQFYEELADLGIKSSLDSIQPALTEFEQNRNDIIGNMYCGQARFYDQQQEYELAIKFYSQARNYGNQPAYRDLALVGVRAGAAVLKTDPDTANQHFKLATDSDRMMIAEVNLVKARAAINGYHPDRLGQVDHTFAFELCKSAIKPGGTAFGMSSENVVKWFRFLYDYAFFEHQIPGYSEWLRDFNSSSEWLREYFTDSGYTKIRFYILLNLIVYQGSQIRAGDAFLDQKELLNQLSEDVQTARELLTDSELAIEKDLYEAILNGIIAVDLHQQNSSATQSSTTSGEVLPPDEKIVPLALPVTAKTSAAQQDDNKVEVSVATESESAAERLAVTEGRKIDLNRPQWKTPMPTVSKDVSPSVKMLLDELRRLPTKPKADDIRIKKLQNYCNPPNRIVDRIAAVNYLSDWFPDLRLHYSRLSFQLGNGEIAYQITENLKIYKKITQPLPQMIQQMMNPTAKAATDTNKIYEGNSQQVIDFWAQVYLLAEGASNLKRRVIAAFKLLDVYEEKPSPENSLAVYEFYLKYYADLAQGGHLRGIEIDLLPIIEKTKSPYRSYLRGLQHEYGFPSGTSDHALAFLYFREATRQDPRYVTPWMWLKLAEYYAMGKGLEQPHPKQARDCFTQALNKMYSMEDFSKFDAKMIYVSRLKELLYRYHSPVVLEMLHEFYKQHLTEVPIEQSSHVLGEFEEIVSFAIAQPNTDPVFEDAVNKAKQSLEAYYQEYTSKNRTALVNANITKNFKVLTSDGFDETQKQQALTQLLLDSRNGYRFATAKLMEFYCRSGNYQQAANCFPRFLPEDRAQMFEVYKKSVGKDDRERALFLWCKQQLLSLVAEADPMQLLLTEEPFRTHHIIVSDMLIYSKDKDLRQEVRLFLLELYTKAREVLGKQQEYNEAFVNILVRYAGESNALIANGKSEKMSEVMLDYYLAICSFIQTPAVAEDVAKKAQTAAEENTSSTIWLSSASFYTGKREKAKDPTEEFNCLNQAKALAVDPIKGMFYEFQLKQYVRDYQSLAALGVLYNLYEKRMKADPLHNQMVLEQFMADLDFRAAPEFEAQKKAKIEALINAGRLEVGKAACAEAIAHAEQRQYEAALAKFVIAVRKGNYQATIALPKAYVNAGKTIISKDPLQAQDYFNKAIKLNGSLQSAVDFILARAAINGHHPQSRGVTNFKLAFDLCERILSRITWRDGLENSQIQALQNNQRRVLNFLHDNQFFAVDPARYKQLLEMCQAVGNANIIVAYFQDVEPSPSQFRGSYLGLSEAGIMRAKIDPDTFLDEDVGETATGAQDDLRHDPLSLPDAPFAGPRDSDSKQEERSWSP